MKKLIILLCIIYFQQTIFAKDFTHPGLLHSMQDLERIGRLANDKVYPAYGSYNLLSSMPGASYNYTIKGPFEYISRAGKYGYTKAPCESDCNAAYYNAIMWSITKDSRHGDKAMEILRKYADTLKHIYGPDDPLCAGLQGFILINAAEIMRYTYISSEYKNGWNSNDTKKIEGMFVNVFLPILTNFVNSKPYSNGNWGASVNKMRLAIGIFTNNRKLYDDAVDFFLHSKDNGSLPNYIAKTGQIQETGRDQAHCMLGVGVLAELAECAWKQGDDLYGKLDNRICKGYEYLSKLNLGYKDLPFTTWKDATGKYCNWNTIGKASMGEFRAVFEIAYNHYAYRKHIKMPYTEKVLKRIRPEGAGWTCDNPGFGTLLFYLGDAEDTPSPGEIREDLEYAWKGWINTSSYLKPQNGIFSLASSGISMKKNKMMYDSSKYPYIEVAFSEYPQGCKDGWLQLSYSVNSAPEYWTFHEKDAVRKDEGRFVFSVKDALSNNGSKFTSGKVSVSILLDFGYIKSVGIKSITSKDKID